MAPKRSIKPRQLQLSRTESVRDALREAILSGELQAGVRLNLDEIAADFGVSRMPVRDAVKQLETEGLVNIFPYRGVEVSSLAADDLEELFTIRRVLEQTAIERAVPRLSEPELQEMRHILEQIDALGSRSSKWMELNFRFHHILNAAAGWPRLIEMIEMLRANVDRYLRAYVAIQGRERPQRQHWAILKACEEGDVEAAKRVLEEHLLDTANALTAALTKQKERQQTEPKKSLRLSRLSKT